MNNELRDPLEKISSSLRRAVTVNKCRESDLRNAVSTIQREERRSLSTWALKQEKFLKARQKLVPTIRMEQIYRRQPNGSVNRQNYGRSTRYNVSFGALPPVITTKIPSKESEMEAAIILAANNNTQEAAAKKLQAKVRRFTDDRKPRITFNDNNIEDNDDNRFTSAKPIGEVAFDVESTKQLGTVLQVASFPTKLRRSMPNIMKREFSGRDVVTKGEFLEPGHRNRSQSEDIQTNLTPLPPIISLLPKETDQVNSRARQNWRKLRESLSKLIDSRERNLDMSKMTLAQLTRMFEDIKECRYLRVGNHTSYRGDSEKTAACKCLVCALKDKSSLRNHMSAPK